MSLSYFVAMPSHERAPLVAGMTLPFLIDAGGVPADAVSVWVAAEQYPTYKIVLHEWLERGVHLRAGGLGIKTQRNLIARSYPQGAQLVSCDDDILGLVQRMTPTDTAPIRAHEVIENGFAMLARHGLTLWGVYPVNNAYFMRGDYTTDLRFICGGFHGMLNDRNEALIICPKEDYERTLRRYERDGGVLRMNNIAFEHGGYKKVRGGLQATAERTEQSNLIAIEQLRMRYPGLVHLNPRRPGEITVRSPRRKGPRS